MRSRYCTLVRSRYARGAVEVRSRYARGAVEVRLWCGRGTLVVRSRYARGAVEVRSRCGRAVEVRSWYGPSTVEVRSWCASGSLPVRYVSLTFQRAILYIYINVFYIYTFVRRARAVHARATRKRRTGRLRFNGQYNRLKNGYFSSKL